MQENYVPESCLTYWVLVIFKSAIRPYMVGQKKSIVDRLPNGQACFARTGRNSIQKCIGLLFQQWPLESITSISPMTDWKATSNCCSLIISLLHHYARWIIRFAWFILHNLEKSLYLCSPKNDNTMKRNNKVIWGTALVVFGIVWIVCICLHINVLFDGWWSIVLFTKC